MADFLKKPLARSLNEVATRRAADALQLTGRQLPAKVAAVVSSGIVQVDFEVNAAPFTLPRVTLPVAYPEYIRYPIQVGDLGMVVAADARLGGVTGLGTGVADLSQPTNLSALTFIWLGSKSWSAADDPQAVVVYGPNGVILRDTAGHTKITITPTGVTVDLPAGQLLTVNANGGTVKVVNGDVLADTISLKNHVHSGVTTGSGDTGAPVP